MRACSESNNVNYVNFFPFHLSKLVSPSSLLVQLQRMEELEKIQKILKNNRVSSNKKPDTLNKVEKPHNIPHKLVTSVPPVLNSSLVSPTPICTLNHDSFSDTATCATVPYTELNNRLFPVYYNNKKHKRIILNWPVFISSLSVSALIDTGATISAMNPDMLPKLPPNIFRVSRIEPFSINLSVEENQQFIIEEQVEVIINVDGHEFLWLFFLVPSLSNDLVLGMDWLSAMHVNIC